MRTPASLAACAAVVLSLACRAETPAGYATRDSAGVHIVESRMPAWTGATRWSVDTVPALALGAVSGALEVSFSGVSGVSRLGDGSLAVADGTSREIRVFDHEGRFVTRFGRRGDGPGEFNGIQTMGVTGDSIWIYDITARRLTFLDAKGGGVRMASVVGVAGLPTVAGRRRDGSFVFYADVLPDLGNGKMPESGFSRPGSIYLGVDAGGVARDTLLVGKGQERILSVSQGDQGPRISLFRPLFSRTSSRAVLGDDLVYGDQDRWELSVSGPQGAPRSLVRRTDVDLTLTEDAFRADEERLVSAAPQNVRPQLREAYAGQPRPATRPAYGRFLAGPDGELWVQDYSLDGTATGWSVFDRDGIWLGVVELPTRFRPFEIGRDEVLGAWRDDLDVEYVRVYRLRRGAEAGR